MKLISRSVSLFVAIILLFSFGVSASKSNENSIAIAVSVIDKSDKDNKVNNVTLHFNESDNVAKSLPALKKIKAIKDYAFVDNQLKSITFVNGKMLETSDEFSFVCRINGVYITNNYEKTFLVNGDIIEWLYVAKSEVTSGKIANETYSSGIIQETPKVNVSDLWDDEMSKALTAACEWLLVKDKPSDNYFTVLGSAGKTASVKSVNQYLKNISTKNKYETPVELEKAILTTTFCGFDAKKIGKVDLIKMLSSYENIASFGVNALCYGMLALDSNNYVVESTALNSRNKLINSLLLLQRDNGSFGDANEANQDYLQQTATAVTALSKYADTNEDVKKSVKSGLEYIQSTRNNQGEYIQNEKIVSSVTLSQIIISFSSNSILVADKTYYGFAKSLKKQILKYQNTDGGFSINKNEASDQMSTEFAVLALSSIRSMSNPYVVSKIIKPQSYVVDEPKSLTNIITDKKSFYVIVISSVLTVILIIVIIILLLKKNKNKKLKK